MRKLTTVSLLLAAGVLAASPVLAQAAKGENIVVPKDSVSTKLPDGKTYMTIGNRQVCTTADRPANPLSRARRQAGKPRSKVMP